MRNDKQNNDRWKIIFQLDKSMYPIIDLLCKNGFLEPSGESYDVKCYEKSILIETYQWEYVYQGFVQVISVMSV